MKRIASLLLAFVLILTMLPMTAQAAEMDGEDVILDYGAAFSEIETQSVELMGKAHEETFVMARASAPGSACMRSTRATCGSWRPWA